MVDVNARFVELANPHAWLLTADNLHQQAVYLHNRRGTSLMTQSDAIGIVKAWDLVDKSVFLLGGFALENAIKSFLVYENPNWISNGRMAKQLKSHSLTSLQKQSTQIPYKNRYLWVLKQFEDGLESWARYPCGLSAEISTDQLVVEVKLWSGYVRLMRAYGNGLMELLSRGWRGPYGFDGSWSFEGDGFLT